MARLTFIQNLLVGILFFGALSIVGYFTIVSESGPFARPGQQLLLFFDTAEGIKEGSRVNVLGVPMGKVAAIDLISVDHNNLPVEDDSPGRVGQRVVLTIELKNPVVFYSNYSISLKSESLLSGKIVSIDPGSLTGTGKSVGASAPVATIPVQFFTKKELTGRNTTALQIRMKEKSGPFVDLQGESVGDPVAGLTEMITENRDDVRRTLRNVADITDKINQGTGTLGKLVNEDDLHKNANTLVNDAQVVVRELRESLEDTREQAPVNSFVRAALTAF